MKKILLSLLLISMSFLVNAEEDYFTGALFSSAAIKGYDVVAYFTEQQAVKGKEDFSYEYKGVVWQFASAENLAAFEASPQKYLPQYGGYCAYAMATYGDKVKVDPEQFTVKEGKLYLNYSRGISKKFRADIDSHIVQADENWLKIVAQ